MQTIQYIFSSRIKIHESLYKWNNINITKSNEWASGYVTVNNMKITDLFCDKDYKIELDFTNTTKFNRYYPTLYINDTIYYQNEKKFNFDVVLNINSEHSSLIKDLSHRTYFETNLIKYSEKIFNLNMDNSYSCKN